MPSGWDIYYVMALSAVFALSLPLALRLISLLVSSRAAANAKTPAALSDAPLSLGQKINTRFFLSANMALLLITFGIVLIPCVGTVRESVGGVFAILTLCALAGIGLLYSARKGDLNWLKALREKQD